MSMSLYWKERGGKWEYKQMMAQMDKTLTGYTECRLAFFFLIPVMFL